MLRRFSLLAILVLVAFAVAACNGDGEENGNDDGAVDGAGATIEVEMGEMYFDPAEIRVGAGETITIVANNVGTVLHDWTIEDLNGERVHIEARPRQSSSATFTAPSEPGEYEILCTQPGHAVAGMVGTLIVE